MPYQHTVNATRFVFNAVKLSPREVASTFVPPPAFFKLVIADNALLVGPRGSGKTTLLKMLQSEAVENWDATEAERVSADVAAVGMFVGADRQWSAQLSTSGTPGVAGPIGYAAFGIHVAQSALKAVQYRHVQSVSDRRRTHLPPTTLVAERDLASLFQHAFDLPREGATLSAVRAALQTRMIELGKIRRMPAAVLPEWAYINPIDAVDVVASGINELSNDPDQRWTFLFDELELAPTDIARELLSRLRGSSAVLNFKLSVAPVLKDTDLLQGESGAIWGQDAEIINLTDMSRRDSTRFSEQLITSELQKRLGRPISLRRVLGNSPLGASEHDATPDQESTPVSAAYEPGGVVFEAIQRLAVKDLSFAKYLEVNGISAEDLSHLEASRRAAKLRKIRNIVLVREYYRGAARRRSRKSLELYTGAGTLLSLPDGNPRMAMTLAGAISSLLENRNSARIPAHQQSELVEAVIERFWTLLSAQTGVSVGRTIWGVTDLLDNVAEVFLGRLLDDDFRADVPMGLRIDADVPAPIAELVVRAVNAGALVKIEKDMAGKGPGQVVGNSYRFAYSLCAHYGLPLYSGKSADLSGILRRGPSLRDDGAIDMFQPQLGVFGEVSE